MLKLSNNQIKTIEEISGLAKCEKLESLDLSNNPIVKELGTEYSTKVRELLPKIDVLDGFNRNGEEVVSEDESDEDEAEDEEEEDAEDDGEEDGEEDDAEDDGEEDEEEAGDEEEAEEEDDVTAADGGAAEDGIDDKLVGKKRKTSEKAGADGDAADNNADAIDAGLDATKKRVNVDPSS